MAGGKSNNGQPVLSQLPLQPLLTGSAQQSPQQLKIDPVTSLQQSMTSGMGSAQLPIMGNSEIGMLQHFQNSQTAMGSPAQMFNRLSPSQVRGNVGGK